MSTSIPERIELSSDRKPQLVDKQKEYLDRVKILKAALEAKTEDTQLTKKLEDARAKYWAVTFLLVRKSVATQDIAEEMAKNGFSRSAILNAIGCVASYNSQTGGEELFEGTGLRDWRALKGRTSGPGSDAQA